MGVERFDGVVAAVTGAASGLGRALACRLAGAGAQVAICDVDTAGLAQTAELVRQAGGAEVVQAKVDVTDPAQVHDFASETRDRFGVVHQIYNNAGIAFVGPFEEVDYADIARVMDVNFWGVVHGCKEFMPHLIESGRGHIVNVSSVFGLTAAPWMAGYDASKFAVRGFTEALRAELLAARRPVRVTCVHPGGIRTPIVRNAGAAPAVDKPAVERRFARAAVSSPDGAARTILRGVRRGSPRVLVGPDAYVAYAAQFIPRAGYERAAALAARWFLPRRAR